MNLWRRYKKTDVTACAAVIYCYQCGSDVCFTFFWRGKASTDFIQSNSIDVCFTSLLIGNNSLYCIITGLLAQCNGYYMNCYFN